MSRPLRFAVIGKPQPAGSKRAYVNQHTGRVAVVEDAKRSKPWQQLVIAAAHDAMNGHQQFDGPLLLIVDFYVRRPAGHYGTGKNAGKIRLSAPRHPAVRPDVTKLLRAVEDALTNAGVWRDDAQIVNQVARKHYTNLGAPERCEILIDKAT